MSAILNALRRVAQAEPTRIALRDADSALRYDELEQAVTTAAHALQALHIGVLGLLADNSISWAVADVAAMTASVPLVPMPLFFSPSQMLHAMRDAGVDALLTDRPEQAEALLKEARAPVTREGLCCGLHLLRLKGVAAKSLPVGTAKITYTSGTTGEPKGVCLSRQQLESVAAALGAASAASASDRHLCLTPLSTLLENIGGVYVPLLAGASSCIAPLRETGLRGAAELEAPRMLGALERYQATTAILAPQMLHGLVAAVEMGAALPQYLRFVAVGGAPVAERLLQRAQQLGLPVFEGYGLSECASVVTLNTPSANRLGSVGRPLPHVRLRFGDDNEVWVDGAGFLGYLGQAAPPQPWPTGDLGYLDAEGYLHLTGRKKSQFITSFGRNVSPEWVERELALQPAIAQAAVFGEAKPFNVAVVVPRHADADIEAALQAANRALPDYAALATYVLATPFSLANGQLTANGRLKRAAIHAAYADQIETIYEKGSHDVF